jgi:hypothetical protein
MNAGDKARAVNTHHRDQAEARQVAAVRRNAKQIKLSRRETQRRVDRVQRRFR